MHIATLQPLCQCKPVSDWHPQYRQVGFPWLLLIPSGDKSSIISFPLREYPDNRAVNQHSDRSSFPRQTDGAAKAVRLPLLDALVTHWRLGTKMAKMGSHTFPNAGACSQLLCLYCHRNKARSCVQRGSHLPRQVVEFSFHSKFIE